MSNTKVVGSKSWGHNVATRFAVGSLLLITVRRYKTYDIVKKNALYVGAISGSLCSDCLGLSKVGKQGYNISVEACP